MSILLQVEYLNTNLVIIRDKKIKFYITKVIQVPKSNQVQLFIIILLLIIKIGVMLNLDPLIFTGEII